MFPSALRSILSLFTSLAADANKTAPAKPLPAAGAVGVLQKPAVILHPSGDFSHPAAFPAQAMLVPSGAGPHPVLVAPHSVPFGLASRSLAALGPGGLPVAATLTGAEARMLLGNMYGAKPESVYALVSRLQPKTRDALMAVIAKAADPSSHVTVAASFLEAYNNGALDTTAAADAAEHVSLIETASAAALETLAELETEQDLEADAEQDAVIDAEAELENELDNQLEAEMDAEADAEADAENEAEADAEAEAEEEGDADADAEMDAEAAAEVEMSVNAEADAELEAEVDAEAEAEDDSAAYAFIDTEAEAETEFETEFELTNTTAAANATVGNSTAVVNATEPAVAAMTNLAAVLASQAQALEASVAFMEKNKKGNMFATMERGPVGRRPTDPKDRFLDQGTRSWEAQGRADVLRLTGARPDQIDQYYSVEPLPTGF